MTNGTSSNACQIQAAMCGAAFRPKWTRRTAVNPLVNHYVASDGVRLFFTLLDPVKDWGNFCRAIDHAELLEDPRFTSPELRTENSAALVAIIDETVARKESAEWRRIFAAHEVIWSPVPASSEVPRDTQMEANGVFVEIAGTDLRTVSNPLTIDGVTKMGLFRNFDASHGAGPATTAGEYGNTRARRSSKPARPYIWRLIILSRLIWPSTWPVLHGVSTAAATAEMSFCRP